MDDHPVERGEDLDADTFKVDIADPDGSLTDFFNGKDPVILRRDGANELKGFVRRVKWKQRDGLLEVEGRDYWHQVWERATRDESFVNTEVADIVRRALGLSFSFREDFLSTTNVPVRTGTVVTGGRLALPATSGVYPTGTAFLAESGNRGKGNTVTAVTLTADDRVGAEEEEVFDALGDNDNSDDAQQTAFYDDDLGLIRLPSDPVTTTYPFADLSQTESLSGAAIISGGALTLQTAAIMDEDFEDGTPGVFERTEVEETTNGESGAPAGETEHVGITIGSNRFLVNPRADPTLPQVRRRSSLESGDWTIPTKAQLMLLHKATSFTEYTVGSSPLGIDWTRFSGNHDGVTIEATSGRAGGPSLHLPRPGAHGLWITWDEFDGTTDFDIVTSAKYNTLEGRTGPIFRFSDDFNDEYQIRFHQLSPSELLRGITKLGDLPSVEVDTWVLIRIQAIGANIKVKIWEHSASEPVAWDLEVIDATFPSGKIGILKLESNVNYWTDLLCEYALWNKLRIKKATNENAFPLLTKSINGDLNRWVQTNGRWIPHTDGVAGLPTTSSDETEMSIDDAARIFMATLDVNDALVLKAYTYNTGTSTWDNDATYEAGLPSFTAKQDLTDVFVDAVTRGGSTPRRLVIKRNNVAAGWDTQVLIWHTGTSKWIPDRQFLVEYGETPNARTSTFRESTSIRYFGRPTAGGLEMKALPDVAAREPGVAIEAKGGAGESWSARAQGPDSLIGVLQAHREGTLTLNVWPTSGKDLYINIGPKTFQLKIDGTAGAVQWKADTGGYVALPTPQSMTLGQWNTLVLEYDTNNVTPANWTCAVSVNAASGGTITYHQAVQDIIAVHAGWVADTAIAHATIDGWFDNFLVDLGTSETLEGEWISDNITDANAHHGFELAPTEATPGTSTLTYYISRDNGATWTQVTIDTFTTLAKTSTQLKLKIELVGQDAANVPSITTMDLDRYYKYLAPEVNWESLSLGTDFKPAKMRVFLVDSGGNSDKSVPAGTTLNIFVSPDGFTNTQAISDGGEAVFDTGLTDPADWRVRFRLSTSDVHKTPEVRSYLLEVEPDGSGQVIRYYVSRDAKGNWHQVTPGTEFTAFGAGESPKNELAWKVEMDNTDATSTPSVIFLAILASTTSDMTGITEGTITDWGIISIDSKVEYYGDLLQRIFDITGIYPVRTFNKATGDQVIDWNEGGVSPTVFEIDIDDLEDLEDSRSWEGQATRVVYAGGES